MNKTFEVRKIECNIRGQGRHTSFFNKITAPEFLIIQSIHGKGSCKIQETQGEDFEVRTSESSGKILRRPRSSESLQEKLISKYTEAVFKKVFPGENPILPYSYDDAGLLDVQNDDTDGYGDGWEEVDIVLGDAEVKVEDKKNKSLALPKKETADELIGKKA